MSGALRWWWCGEKLHLRFLFDHSLKLERCLMVSRHKQAFERGCKRERERTSSKAGKLRIWRKLGLGPAQLLKPRSVLSKQMHVHGLLDEHVR